MNSKVRESSKQSKADQAQFEATEEIFNKCSGQFADKIEAFSKFASRHAIAKFLTKYELFKRILSVNGSTVECAVLHGGGLFTGAKFHQYLNQ